MTGEESWPHLEVEAAVADYLHMLTLELSGQAFNKTIHRRALQTKLKGRSEGAIERKHQNISAVLIELGCPYIAGYKPLRNYQSALFDIVLRRIEQDPLLEKSAASAVEQPAVMPLVPVVNMLLESPPTRTGEAREELVNYLVATRGIKRDYFEREARNRSLGLAGEELVVAFERHRLEVLGKQNLSGKVEHIAKTKGDGLGFDVLSFDEDGRERFIEGPAQ